MPKESRMKNIGITRQQAETLGRRDKAIGGIHCPICHLFFNDNPAKNIAEYYKCSQHGKLKGYKLL